MVINSQPTSTDVEPLYSRQLRSQTSACKVPSRHALWLQVASCKWHHRRIFHRTLRFHHSFSTLFFCVSNWNILWKNSMLSTRRKDKEMKQTKKSHTQKSQINTDLQVALWLFDSLHPSARSVKARTSVPMLPLLAPYFSPRDASDAPSTQAALVVLIALRPALHSA